MFQNELLNRIAKNAPVTVMTRALLENVLNPTSLDSIFQRHVRTQRQRNILFSFVVELMLLADAYPKRWQIETAFQEIEALLSGEINTLGYPEAALFSLSCAYVAYNILQCIRLTLEASHPECAADKEISLYYVADDVAHTWRGLDAILSDGDWEYFRDLSPKELATALRVLAMLVPLRKYTKRRSNPRPPTTQRSATKRKNHASTAKLLDKKHNLNN